MNENESKQDETVESTNAQGTGEVDTQTTNQNEGTDVVEETLEEKAQKLADGMLKKKMKGMPTKEELKAFKEWQESQKTDEEKQSEREKEYTNTLNELSETKKELAVYKAGVTNSDNAEFVIFKVSKMEGDFEENLEDFLKENPKYLEKEDNKVEEKVATGISVKGIVANKSETGVRAILKAKHPDLY